MPFITTGEQLQVFLFISTLSPDTRALAFSFCPHNVGFVLFSFFLFSFEHPLRAPCSLCKWLLLLYPPAARQPHTHILTHCNSLSDSKHTPSASPTNYKTAVLADLHLYLLNKTHALLQLQPNLCTSVLWIICALDLNLRPAACRWWGEGTARLSLNGGVDQVWARRFPGSGTVPSCGERRGRGDVTRQPWQHGLCTGTWLNPLAALP